MAANYWQRDWFESGYFPEIWFAPADETDVPVEELKSTGGGPDSSDSSRHGRTETPEDLEHIERKAEHGRRMYAKDEPVLAPLPPPAEPSAVAPARETPGLFYSDNNGHKSVPVDTTAIAADLNSVTESIDALQAEIDERNRHLSDEEEAILLLLAA